MRDKNRLIFWGASGQAIVLEEFLAMSHKIEVEQSSNGGSFSNLSKSSKGARSEHEHSCLV